MIQLENVSREYGDGKVVHALDHVSLRIGCGERVAVMSTPPDGTKTVLLVDEIKFNAGLKEDLFTQQALEKPDL